ncbi:EexN family lipoprotein [Raoultella terrigena]|uniref:EexN family lipoprotein n=1 Tax=Raoultella terrigena TaxID=577 RepID=UPI00090824F9|nr:EexN family lipoprotein [Raoultella terrigena]
MKSLPVVLITVSVLLLSGCKDVKSESWYKQHPKETYSTYSQCLKDGEASDNCEFAYRAALMFAHEKKSEFIELFEQKAEARRNALK